MTIESLTETGHIFKRASEIHTRYEKYLERLTTEEADEHLYDDVFPQLSMNQLLNLLNMLVDNVVDKDWSKEIQADIEQTVHRLLDAIEGYLESH